jgi:hypothetical protein
MKIEVRVVTVKRAPLIAWCGLAVGVGAALAQLSGGFSASGAIGTGVALLLGAVAATRVGSVLELGRDTVTVKDLDGK